MLPSITIVMDNRHKHRIDGNPPITTQERDILNPPKYDICFLTRPRHD